MPIEIERLSIDRCELGESPFWDEKSQSIYFVDIIGKTVNRYTPSTNAYVKAVVGDRRVSFIIPIEGQENTFLIGYGNEIAKLTWDGVSTKIQGVEPFAELKNTREKNHVFNDGKVAPSGQLWAGIYLLKDTGGLDVISNEAALFALKSNGKLDVIVPNVTLSNGLVWNEQINKFYYIDSVADEVYQFDYNAGKITNRKTIFKFSETGVEGVPDGMTIDNEGHLWIACFGGFKIIKIDPNTPNTLLDTIELPVKQVACVEFAGPNYEDLYVMTGGIALGGAPAPDGGYTYKITGLGVTGFPPRRVKL